ncbi:MAG: hypothetical protein K8F27_06285 [Sulfuricellaceae bacterium]|nr:hypothetical protein [Sulfuricellaceae bacterium]
MKPNRLKPSLLLAVVGLSAAAPAHALNYYELEVYPYKTAAKGELELENATSQTRSGPKAGGDGDASVSGQVRTSFEATYGVTDKTEISAYGDFFRAPGADWAFGGQRYHVRTRFFEKGELPVDLGAYVEFEMPKHDTDTHEIEVRGIMEKDFGKWTFDFNPIFEKVLKGDAVSDGWSFQYAASAIYRLNERVQPRLDFFGDFGQVRNFLPRAEQIHLISPAIDFHLEHNVKVQAGVAFGLTDATEQRLIRVRLEKEFY